MENTVVQPWSWPCVLVFVKDWLKPADYHAAAAKGQVVPPFIYLPDGRVIPTCVVQASLWNGADTRLVGYQFSKQLMGGGYPVITKVQGKEHVGSVGCLVTDGVRHFALTNQHVAGEAGSEIFTLLQGDGRRIGVSATSIGPQRSLSANSIPDFPGESTRANLDIGLIDVDDLAGLDRPDIRARRARTACWNSMSIPSAWTGSAPTVVAHGAHSGNLKGEIKALFYRYRVIDGVDYVSDFLMGGTDGAPLANHARRFRERCGASRLRRTRRPRRGTL